MSRKKLEPEKERELVERSKKDIQAFGQLYDVYIDDIYLFIYYKVGGKHDAEDLTALTFEKAMKGLQKFEWKGFSFGSWLYTIARNLIIDEYKKKRDIVSIEEVIDFTVDIEQENPEEEVATQLDTKKLLEALSLLPEDQKEVIYLRYVKDMNIKETMEITKRTIDSVKSLSKRGLQKLKELMKESDKILDPNFANN